MKLVFPTLEYKENLASSGTILNNGGRLIKEKYSETFKEMIQMYAVTK